MPVVSIVVPVYNQEKYLAQCIDSLLGQTFSELEIILVDDGSTDQSGAICDNYAKRDDRIKVIHKKNGGLSDARNAGIDIAKSEYIAFVDSDDFVERDIYKKLYHSLKEADADIAVCNCMIVDEKSKEITNESDKCVLLDHVYTGGQILDGQGTYWLNVVAWNKLYRKEIFEQVRYPKGKYHEDEFIFHELYGIAKKIICISEKLYFYRKTSGTITDPRNVIYTLDRAEAMYNRINFCIGMGYVKNVLAYEKTMFISLETVARRGKHECQDRAKFNRVRQMNRKIVKQLYCNGFISLAMLAGRYIFYLLPGLWWFDQIMRRICNKLVRVLKGKKTTFDGCKKQ